MSKKTVNISEQLLISVLIGFAIAVLIVVIGHLSPKKWTAMPQNSGYSSGLSPTYVPYSTPVSSCSYECMFGERHSADCTGHNVGDFSNTTLSIGDIFSASFEHTGLIFIIGIIGSSIIYVVKRINFKVVKE